MDGSNSSLNWPSLSRGLGLLLNGLMDLWFDMVCDRTNLWTSSIFFPKFKINLNKNILISKYSLNSLTYGFFI